MYAQSLAVNIHAYEPLDQRCSGWYIRAFHHIERALQNGIWRFAAILAEAVWYIALFMRADMA